MEFYYWGLLLLLLLLLLLPLLLLLLGLLLVLFNCRCPSEPGSSSHPVLSCTSSDENQ